MKGNARKVHRLYNGKVLAGFAGGTADAFTLLERFEAKLQAHQGNLERAAVALARTGAPIAPCAASKPCWPSPTSTNPSSSPATVTWCSRARSHRHRQRRQLCPVRRHRLLENTELDARTIVEKSLKIAGDICVFTNGNHTIEVLDYSAK